MVHFLLRALLSIVVCLAFAIPSTRAWAEHPPGFHMSHTHDSRGKVKNHYYHPHDSHRYHHSNRHYHSHDCGHHYYGTYPGVYFGPTYRGHYHPRRRSGVSISIGHIWH